MAVFVCLFWNLKVQAAFSYHKINGNVLMQHTASTLVTDGVPRGVAVMLLQHRCDEVHKKEARGSGQELNHFLFAVNVIVWMFALFALLLLRH